MFLHFSSVTSSLLVKSDNLVLELVEVGTLEVVLLVLLVIDVHKIFCISWLDHDF